MNKVFLIGRITKDLELEKTAGGTSVVKFSVAVQRDKDNADFPNVVVYGKMADNLCQYQHKGSLIGIDGRIQTRTYQRNDGSNAYVTEVIANNVEYLSSKSQTSGESAQNGSYREPVNEHVSEPMNDIPYPTDDDLPW